MLRRCGSLPAVPFLCLLLVLSLCFSYSKLTVLADPDGPHECSQGGHGAHDLIQNGVMNSKYQWYKRGKKTYVPVVMDHSYSYKEHSVIVGGLQEISQKTCIEFDVYDNEAEVEEKDYVYINKNTKRGCYSYIGRIGGKQEIGLPVGCISHRTAMHEMLHALGFRHEHVRYDRDDYIIVFWGNIRQGRESNFKKRSPSDLVSGPYDYESIMHYERKAFSHNGMDTIKPLKQGAKIGVRQEMSYWDAQKVNIVYKCGGQYSSASDVSSILEHSPALFQYNEGSERNESLPIAEYDDFNREPAQPRPPIRGRGHDHENDIHPDDHDQHDDHNPFDPPPPPPPRRDRDRDQPRRPDHFDENNNEPPRRGESFPADDHYGNNNNDHNNRIHYRNNHHHERPPPQNREHFDHHQAPRAGPRNRNHGPRDEFLNYLTERDDTSSGHDGGSSGTRSTNSDNNNNDNGNGNGNNGGPFYDDFYDF